MLIPERADLIRWLSQQSDGVSSYRMEELNAPGYTHSRIEEMYKEGLLSRSLGVEHDEIVGLYSVSDKGKAMLAEHDEALRKEAEDLAQRKLQNKISITQALVPLLTFILGLLVEHFSGVIDLLSKYLG